MAFKATRTVVSLEPEDLMRLQEILIDEDPNGALAFLRDVIADKVRCAQDESHRPEFEGGLRLHQAPHRSAREAHDRGGSSSPTS
jgi:hypothetical protein